MLVNHETGALQPVAELAEACRQYGALLHTDAVQALGKTPTSFTDLAVDAMTITAHKIHGPVGIGALILRDGVLPHPRLLGGFQQGGIRPGTESPVLPSGFAAALRYVLQGEGRAIPARLQSLRDRFEAILLEHFPNLRIHSAAVARAPHVSNVSWVGQDRQALVMSLDLAGVACSTGSACSSGSSEPSPVLSAMGAPAAEVASAVRFSFGAQQSLAEVEEAARRVCATVK